MSLPGGMAGTALTALHLPRFLMSQKSVIHCLCPSIMSKQITARQKWSILMQLYQQALHNVLFIKAFTTRRSVEMLRLHDLLGMISNEHTF